MYNLFNLNLFQKKKNFFFVFSFIIFFFNLK